MKQWILGGASAAALMVGPQAAFALTPQEALDYWYSMAGEFGLSVEDDGQSTSGGTLSVRGMRYVAKIGPMTAVYSLGDVALSDNGDGTVSGTYPAASSMSVDASDGDESFKAKVSFSHPDIAMILKDADNGVEYSYTAPHIDFTLDEVSVNGAPIDATLSYSLEGISNTTVYSGGTNASLTGDTRADKISGGHSYSIPEAGVSETQNVDAQQFVSAMEIHFGALKKLFRADLAGMGPEEGMGLLGEIMDSGFRVSGKSSTGAYSAQSVSVQEFGKFSTDVSVASYETGIDLDGSALDMSGMATSLAGTVVVEGDMPLPPIAFAAESAEMGAKMPFTEGEGDIAYKIAAHGLTVEESLWSMIDPGAVLPRDPATLVVDLTGKVNWKKKLFSAEVVGVMEPPIELTALNIDALQLAIGGADLQGTGAFTFDNTDMTTFDGIPRPEGQANLRLTGGNALLDGLTKMGLVPEDQVMVVRMMAGMFAKPGAGPDELTSEIVIDGTGKVLINGAPIPF